MKLRILIACTLIFGALGMPGAANPVRSDMVVHEWGTFLAMNGSNGVSLDGMYHDGLESCGLGHKNRLSRNGG